MPDPEELQQQLDINVAASVVESVQHPLLQEHKIRLYIKRDDRLHNIISGNKWRKLKFSLVDAINSGHDHLISMGGQYSNHLHALAYIGQQLNIKTTGLIRGEPAEKENRTLRDLRDWGMHLEFISRSDFRTLRTYQQSDSLPASKYKGYWLPEGGRSQLALKGIAELVDEIKEPFDTLTLACGTGTTLAGIAEALPENKKALGFAALKGASFLENDIQSLLVEDKPNWTINHDYHFGGFAKKNDDLSAFIDSFEEQTNIPLEPVYTGKMLYGLFDLIKQNYFKPEERIIVIHTGGLQGTHQ